MISFEEFKVEASKIPYQYRHPEFLYALVKWLKPTIVVEVGTHIGMSAVWMARGVQENGFGKLYCIDNFCWKEESQELQWNDNIDNCRVGNVIELLKGRSQKVKWPDKVDIAFIDGNHTYSICRWDTYKAKSLGATCIILHDTVSWEGSRRFSEEVRQQWVGWDFLEVMFDCGLMVALKREEKGPCEGQDIGEKWDKV